jgi:hypothetical protein
MRKKIMCLFEGRHNMPDYVEGAVLHNIHDITDLKKMSEQCHESLQDCNELVLFVTGLTPAIVSVVNYCTYNHIPLTLMHYNKNDDSYFRQVVYVPEKKEKKYYKRELQMV